MILRLLALSLALLLPLRLLTAQAPKGDVGKQACGKCHASEQKTVAGGPHENGRGCEGCHGPGQQHLTSPAEPRTMFSYRRATAAEVRERCGKCHRDATMATHAVGDVGCTACHSSHHYVNKKYLLKPSDNFLQHPA